MDYAKAAFLQKHLAGGELIDEEMLRRMAEHLEPVAWLMSWTQKKRDIWYSCCGGRMTWQGDRCLNDMEHAQLMTAQHRQHGYCPYCGRRVYYINRKHVSQKDVKEAYHTFYRRSRTDPGTLMVIGVWCGKVWSRVKYGTEPESIQMEIEPCSVILIPYGGKPERWVREQLKARSAWWYQARGSEQWSRRSKVVGECWQSWDGQVLPRTMHLDELEMLLTAWPGGKAARWLAAHPKVYYDRDWVDVLYFAARYPQAEYMIARGLGEMAVDKLMRRDGYMLVNWRTAKVDRMLPLTHDELGRIKAKGLTPASRDMLPLIAGRAYGQKIKLEDAMDVMACLDREPMDRVDRCVRPWGNRWGVMRILRYLARQEVQRLGAPGLWLDYLRELEQLGGLEDERTVFPRDLLAAHTETSRRIQIRKSEEDEKLLRKRLPALMEKYAFEAEGLVLRPFESLAEVIAEGQVQSICIGSYAKRYAEGGTDLCTLRPADAQDKPWHAVEFGRGGRMYQCRGYQNKTDEKDEKKVRAFWAAWDRAHGTKTDPGLIIRRSV